jgi:hypothetical protein
VEENGGYSKEFFVGWGVGKEKDCVEWVAVCRSKEHGGLGIRNLRLVNISLLAKWRWRLLTSPDSIWASLLRVKYGLEGGASSDMVDLASAKFASLWWQDICQLGVLNGAVGGRLVSRDYYGEKIGQW